MKTLEDFDFDAQPAARQQLGALASGGFLTEARNDVLLGPPGTGKTYLATALGVAAARHGHRVLVTFQAPETTSFGAVDIKFRKGGRRTAWLAQARLFGCS